MWNRQLERLSIEREFEFALRIIGATLDAEGFKWVDCEALERRHGIGRGSLVVLDVIPEPSLAGATYEERRGWLQPVLYAPDMLRRPLSENSVFLVPRSAQPETHWQLAREANLMLRCEFYEGIVMKRGDSIYPQQLRSSSAEFAGWVKHRWAF
jgi:hypothetical protein